MTGVALIAGLLLALYVASDPLWAVLMIAIACAGAWEWSGLMRLAGSLRYLFVALTAVACGMLAAAQAQDSAFAYLPALAFWVFAAPLWLQKGLHLHNRVALWLVGWLLLLPAPLAMIHLRSQSPELLLVVVGVVVIADSAAYFTGRRFGQRKLAPSISPGKTWEGALGAWLAVTVYALLVHSVWPQTCGFDCLPQVLAAFWILFILSVLGDLFESWMKRQAGVKDSGSLLPGHGGVLDRIDSLTAVLPAAALFWMWLR